MVIGGIRDEAALRPLLAGNLPRDGALIVSAQQVGQILPMGLGGRYPNGSVFAYHPIHGSPGMSYM